MNDTDREERVEDIRAWLAAWDTSLVAVGRNYKDVAEDVAFLLAERDRLVGEVTALAAFIQKSFWHLRCIIGIDACDFWTKLIQDYGHGPDELDVSKAAAEILVAHDAGTRQQTLEECLAAIETVKRLRGLILAQRPDELQLAQAAIRKLMGGEGRKEPE